MHPAHVPLMGESKAAELNGVRYLRPCRGLFSDEHCMRIVLADSGVKSLEEIDSFKVLVSAEPVGNILLSSVVSVEH